MMKCSCKQVLLPPQLLWKHVPCLTQSSHPQNGDTVISSRELQRPPGSSRPPLRAQERTSEVLCPVCWAEEDGRGVNCNTCLSLGFDLGEHYSAQTRMFCNAQPGMKAPSAPWWTEPGDGMGDGGGTILSASQICFVLLLP